MKHLCNFIKPLSVLLAFCFFVSAFSVSSSYVSGASYDNLSASEKKAVIEQRLKETNEKLNSLSKQSTETQDYLDALNDKIEYLQKDMAIVKAELTSAEENVDSLQKQYENNETEIKNIEVEIENLSTEMEESKETFDKDLESYKQRIRAIYISGDTNILSFLLTSDDLSVLLTRYEMIKRVSKHDGELLKTVDEGIAKIQKTQDELTEKSKSLSEKQVSLVKTKDELSASLVSLKDKKSELEEKNNTLSDERATANTLLKKLNDKSAHYTEYLNNDQEELEALDDEISAAAEKYKPKTTTTTTTKKATTEKTTSSNSSSGGTTTTTKKTTSASSSSRYISLTYPVPSQTKITCGFGQYAGHSGCDFSCASGSRVVAAESGTVIISKDLKNSDGSYRSYGRYIVIAHDKTTSSGNEVYTLYAHNSQRLVSAGDYVQKGQLIAYSGSTGNSTGPHCHFEVRTPTEKYKDCKNPANYLP